MRKVRPFVINAGPSPILRQELTVLALPSTARPETASRPHLLNKLITSPALPARVARLLLAVLIAGLGILALSTPIKSLEEPFVYRKDLIQEYILAKAVLAGDNPYLISVHPADLIRRYIPEYRDSRDLHLPGYTPSAHPPTVAALSAPLSILNYSTVAVLWLLFEIICLAISVYTIVRASGFRLAIWQVLIITAGLLAWHPLPYELALGQLTLLQVVFLGGAWWAQRSDRTAVAGALVAMVLLTKPTIWPLLLVFLIRGEWRALAVSASVFAVGWIVVLGWAGFDTVGAYLTQALPAVNEGYRAQSWNSSLWTVGWKLFDGTGATVTLSDSAPPLFKSAMAARVVSFALPAAGLLMGCLVARRLPSTTWAIAFMTCIAIMVSPIFWSYYLILTLVPAAMVMEWLVRHRMPIRETNAALLVAILLIIPPEGLAELLASTAGWLYPAVSDGTRSFLRVMAYLEPDAAAGALAWLVASLGMRSGGDAARLSSIPPF